MCVCEWLVVVLALLFFNSAFRLVGRTCSHFSESVSRSEGLAAIHNELDLGATTPLLGLDAVGMHALRLRQQVEVLVRLLGLILVVVNTELVVVG